MQDSRGETAGPSQPVSTTQQLHEPPHLTDASPSGTATPTHPDTSAAACASVSSPLPPPPPTLLGEPEQSSIDQIAAPATAPFTTETPHTMTRTQHVPDESKPRPAYNDPAPPDPVAEGLNPKQSMSRFPGELQQDDNVADDNLADATDDTGEDAEDVEDETTDAPTNTSSEDARYLEQLKLQEEIEDLETAIDGLSDYYKIVDRLGEGTFSSVYKAIDLQHFAFDNDEWVTRGPLDPFRKGVCHVALKKIYVTSSPQRIFNELSIMEDLRPAEYVSYLITAFRAEDQIVAVMPYSRHRDFRDYYREMPIGDFKYYFRCLFSALQSVHEAGIMHRDIKPANFLYDPTTGHGTLCDFGLAERFEATEWRGKCHHTCPTPRHPHGTREINRAVDSIWFEPGKPLAGQASTSEGGPLAPNSLLANSASGASASTGVDVVGTSSKAGNSAMNPPPERAGYLMYDARQAVRANRAGTRGFRAPEVLFKCQDQTVAIDIWSAGIILLTLLIRRFPVFNSTDDVEALLEIAVVFGKSRMETCAMLHNRTFQCNIPTVTQSTSLVDFIHRLNPDLRNPGNHPDPEQYAEDVANALDLVKSCLHLDCTRRKTAAELLQHPFLQVEPEEETMVEDDQYMGQEQDFADYYRVGDEGQMDEEDELGDAEENAYMRSEEVVQLRSRREGSEAGEPTKSLAQPTALKEQHHQHYHPQHQYQQSFVPAQGYAAPAPQQT